MGNGCHLRIFWLKTSLRSLPVSNEPLQLGFLFFICAPRVSRHNYSGRPSQNGHGLQFSFSNNSEGNRGEGSREKNPKPQKRMKTLLSPVSKMKKSKSPSHSTQLSTHSIQASILGRLQKRRHFGEVRSVSSAFMASRILCSFLP